MAEEEKFVAQDEFMFRILELQSQYGIDQESMLIYLNSVNLMQILGLIQKKYRNGAAILPPVQFPGAEVPSGMPVGSGAGSGGLSLENMAAMLSTLMNQGGGAGQGGGKGMNPATLMSLYNMLGGQNLDWGAMMNMLSGMFGNKQKATAQEQAAPAVEKYKGQDGEKSSPGEDRPASREVPKVMKWDRFDGQRRA